MICYLLFGFRLLVAAARAHCSCVAPIKPCDIWWIAHKVITSNVIQTKERIAIYKIRYDDEYTPPLPASILSEFLFLCD